MLNERFLVFFATFRPIISKSKRQISDFFFQNYVCDSKIVEKIYRSNLASLLKKIFYVKVDFSFKIDTLEKVCL